MHAGAHTSRTHFTMLPMAVCAAAGSGFAWMLWRYDPTSTSWFPPCIFHRLTGLYCPGCGSTRALHALTHADLAAAWRFNPLMVVALPIVIALLAKEYGPKRDARGGLSSIPAKWIWAFFGVVIAFWITRNLPWYPCTLLAPRGA